MKTRAYWAAGISETGTLLSPPGDSDLMASESTPLTCELHRWRKGCILSPVP